MQSSSSPQHRHGHITITTSPEVMDGEGEGGEADGRGYRLNRRRSTTTTTTTNTTTGVESCSDHEPNHQNYQQQLRQHFLADIRPSSRRFLGADEFYCGSGHQNNNHQDDDTSGGGVEYAVLVPDSFAVMDMKYK